jgi:hypothetical protein
MTQAQTISDDQLKLYHIYGDESCVTAHPWMALGATILSAENRERVARAFTTLKHKRGMPNELKWERLSAKNLTRYQEIVDLYFEFSRANVLRFHALTIPMFAVDHWKYNDGVPDIGYNKFVYQLLLNQFMRRYGAGNIFQIDLDSRTTNQPIEPMQYMLNNGAKSKFGFDHRPCRQLQFRDSKAEIMLQINDILLGAIGLCANRKDNRRPATHPTVILARHIRDKAGLLSLRRPTPQYELRFTVAQLIFKSMPLKGKRRRGARRPRKPKPPLSSRSLQN